MQRCRFLAVASALAGIGCAIGVACSFPDVSFAPPGDSRRGTDDGGPDAPREVGGDVSSSLDAGDPDGTIVKDAGEKIDASGCTTCDCDKDTFNDLLKAGCANAGGLNDCDDTDTTTRPNQGYNETPPYPPRNGDWNCKNGVERVYTANVTCPATGGAACEATQGFSDDPACGAAGSYIKCKTTGATPPVLPGNCVIDSRELRTQACK